MLFILKIEIFLIFPHYEYHFGILADKDVPVSELEIAIRRELKKIKRLKGDQDVIRYKLC